MKTNPILASMVVVSLAGLAHGQVFLSGVVSYGADAAGASTTEPAEYDNLPSSPNAAVTINGQPRGTTFALTPGVNNFLYSGVGGNYNALSLYFSSSGDPFNRPFNSFPDLVVYGFASPLTPIAGIAVQTNGQFSGTLPYSGAVTHMIGAYTVRVTGFTAVSGNGSFQLTVTAPPACPGDADGDRSVGLGDIAVLINNWTFTVPPAPASADLDGSGVIGLGDIAVIINHWAVNCP